ncbi:tetratricopeptide repeat protein [Methylophaga sp. OBS4]|nr:tetratricopeptide repeat protein [Methylophaga sp. OBS4]
MLGGQFDKAMTRAEKGLQLEAENIDALLLKASVLTKQENFGDARVILNQALQLEPDNPKALSLEIVIHKDKGELQKALALVDKALQRHKNDLSLQFIKLDLLNESRNFVAMQPVYEVILKQQPDERSLFVAYSQFLNNQLGKYDEAVGVLQAFVDKHPADTEAKQVLVSLINSKNPEKAIQTLDSLIKDAPDNYQLRFYRVILLMENDNREAARSELESVMADNPEGLHGNKARIALASIEASDGNLGRAERLIQQVLSVAPEESEALLLRAKLELQKGNTEQAITDLRTVLRNVPESDEALVLLAQAYVKIGSKELAEDSYRQALAINPYNTAAALSVAKNLMTENNFDRTEEVLMNALKSNPTGTKLLQALTQVRILKKDWTGGLETVGILKGQDGDSALSHLFSGQLYEGQGDFTLAAEEYKLALAADPDMSRALQGLAISLEQLEQHEALVKYISDFNNKYPEKMDGHEVLAVFYFRNDQPDKAVAVLEGQLSEHSDWARGYSLLADHYIKINQPEKAIAVFTKGLERSPGNIQIAMQLATLHVRQGNYIKARSLYEDMLAKDNSIDIAANNLASLLTDRFESDESLQQALKLANRFKDATEPFYLDTYAWVNVKTGNLDAAQPILERVVATSGSIAVFNYHLGVLYSKRGNTQQAKKYLDIAYEQAGNQEDTALMAAIKKVMDDLE